MLGAAAASAIFSSALLLYASTHDLDLPPLDQTIALLTEDRPAVLIAAVVIGLGVTQLALSVYASALAGLRRVLLVSLIALLGVAPLAELLSRARVMSDVYPGHGDAADRALATLTWVCVAGITGVAAAVMISAAVASGRLLRARNVPHILFSLPDALLLVLWIAARAWGRRSTASSIGATPTRCRSASSSSRESS